jgi:hypothetical protein
MIESFALKGLFKNDSDKAAKPLVKPQRLDPKRGSHLKQRLEKIVLILAYLAHDGRKWSVRRKQISIAPFTGERRIGRLPVYPAEFANDPDGSIRKRLIVRGKQYQKLTTRGLYHYLGDTLSGTKRSLNCRIMIDSETLNYDKELAGARYGGKARDESSSGTDWSDSSAESPKGGDSGSDSSVSLDSGSDDGRVFDGRRRRRRRHGYVPERKKPVKRKKAFVSVRLPKKRLFGGKTSDDILMICDREVSAYVLEERSWVLVDVEKVTACSFQDNVMDDLQVSDETKRLIQALSQTYALPSDVKGSSKDPMLPPTAWTADFVSNKGRGQILLLHGKPGVGKTTAAECVAELTQRPLLSITCGDLGTEGSEVERALTRWLRLGVLWKAVLLFDEADIFLESRSQGDIERNSLVSLFLRALEYYQGLIFLTTNRIGTFDEAIISRVHVILHFPDLTDDYRQRIWDTSFRKLQDERKDIEVDFTVRDYAYTSRDIIALQWNGREIRNAFNTMIALARWDAKQKNRYTKEGKVQIRREHLQEVTKLSSGFKEYMKSLRGMDDAQHALTNRLRDDTFRLVRA